MTKWQKTTIVFARSQMLQDLLIYPSRLFSLRTSNVYTHIVIKHDSGIKAMINEKGRGRDSQLGNQNRFEMQQELLQQFNEGPSQPVCKRNIGIGTVCNANQKSDILQEVIFHIGTQSCTFSMGHKSSKVDSTWLSASLILSNE